MSGPRSAREEWTHVAWYELMRAAGEKPRFLAAATVEPRRAIAGRPCTVRLTIRPLAEPIREGGRVAVLVPRDFGGRAGYAWPDGFSVVGARPGYAAGVSAACADDSVELGLRVFGRVSMAGHFTLIDVFVERGEVRPGGRLVLTLGDEREQPVHVQTHAGGAWFVVAVDAAGDGAWRRISGDPVMAVVGDAPVRLVPVAPASVQPGELVELAVVAQDRHGNPSALYGGRVRLAAERDASAGVAGAALPSPAHFMRGAGGVVRLSGASFTGSGVVRISASETRAGLAGRSNPVAVGVFDAEERLYFGDLHVHTILSDGSGSPAGAFSWARDALLLDFAAITDHIDRPVSTVWSESVKRAYLRAFDQFDQAGRFVTLPGYEWTGWDRHGDRSIYFRSVEEVRWCGANAPESDRPDKLFAALEGVRALVVPHHTRVLGHADWSSRDDRVQRLAEVYSWWGQSLEGGPYSVTEALRAGHRLGFTAGTDSHRGRPGMGRRDAFDGAGLTAVWAPKLTREAIFDALRARRCYATTGARIVLHMAVNGEPMGSELAGAAGRPVALAVRVYGTEKLVRIDVRRRSGPAYTIEPASESCEFELECAPGEPGDYLYVSAEQMDGHRAWSSPVWLDA